MTNIIKNSPIILDNINLNPFQDSTFNLGSKEKKWNTIHTNSIQNDKNFSIILNNNLNTKKQLRLLSNGINSDAILLETPLGGLTINSKMININGDISLIGTNHNVFLKNKLKIMIDDGSYELNCKKNIKLISSGLSKCNSEILIENLNGTIHLKSNNSSSQAIKIESELGGVDLKSSILNLSTEKSIILNTLKKKSLISIGNNNIENNIIIGNENSTIKLNGTVLINNLSEKFNEDSTNLLNLDTKDKDFHHYGIHSDNRFALYYDIDSTQFIFSETFEIDDNSFISSNKFAKICVSDININDLIQFKSNGYVNINNSLIFEEDKKNLIIKDCNFLLKSFTSNYTNLTKIYEFYVGQNYNFRTIKEAITATTKYPSDKIITIKIMDNQSYREDITIMRPNINIVGPKNKCIILGNIHFSVNNLKGFINFENLEMNEITINNENLDIILNKINIKDNKKTKENLIQINCKNIEIENSNFIIKNSYSSLINLNCNQLTINTCLIKYLNYPDNTLLKTNCKENIRICNSELYGNIFLNCNKLDFENNFIQTFNSTFIYLNCLESSNIIQNRFNLLDEESIYPIKWIDFINEEKIPYIMESNNFFYQQNRITNESIRLKPIFNNSLSIANNFCFSYEKLQIYDDVFDISSEKTITEINSNLEMNSEGFLEVGNLSGQIKIIVNRMEKGEFILKYNNTDFIKYNKNNKNSNQFVWNDSVWIKLN